MRLLYIFVQHISYFIPPTSYLMLHTIHAIQRIPVSPQDAWAFFATAVNLQKITPETMKFVIRTKNLAPKIFPGQIIEYHVSPLFGIPMYWKTEITEVEEGKYFIDEQRKGPYSTWHHEHYFKPIDGGVEMTDIVHYKIPYSIFGTIANAVLVKKKLSAIFRYRFHQIEKHLGSWPGQQPQIKFGRQ